jgi:DNA repair exonuclease SbcCD ATPase subunit
MVPLADDVRLEKLAEVKQQAIEVERYKATAEKRRDDAAKQLQEAELAWKLAAGKVDSLMESIVRLRQQIKAISASSETVEQLEAEEDRLNRTLKSHDTATREFSILSRNIASSYKNIELLETEKRDLEHRIATLNTSIPAGTDKTALERRLQELRIASTNVAEVSRALVAAEAVLSSKASTVTDISEKLNREDILCALENFSIDDIGIHMNYNSVLSPVIDALEDRDNKYRTTQATLSSLYSSMAQLLQHRQELTEKMEAESARLQLIEDLETVGRMTNKNGLPLAYMNSVFDHITDMVQEMLSKMGANFTVIKDDERPCTFRFIRTDDNSGYSMPQEMLSGGQAIRLSLALLIACQQLILPEVGLLVLDEPSSHMDAEGVDSLKELFLQMTSIFHSSETQLITVDHNPSLVAALEKVIHL